MDHLYYFIWIIMIMAFVGWGLSEKREAKTFFSVLGLSYIWSIIGIMTSSFQWKVFVMELVIIMVISKLSRVEKKSYTPVLFWGITFFYFVGMVFLVLNKYHLRYRL